MACEVLRRFQLALDECLVDDDLGSHICEFASLPSFYLLAHRFKASLHPVDADRDTIDRRKRLRVLGERRR